jgi:hypothetical protein
LITIAEIFLYSSGATFLTPNQVIRVANTLNPMKNSMPIKPKRKQRKSYGGDKFPLFSFYGIQLVNYLHNKTHFVNNRLLLFTISTYRLSSVAIKPPVQLLLPMMQPKRPNNVVRFLPHRQRAYLEDVVYDVFSTIPELRDVGSKITDAPYRCDLLGYLIQLTEDEVLETFPFVDRNILELMKTRLAEANLGFGTYVPSSWQRPPLSRFIR